ncbi:MAG TPA: S28 family serine protease [Methanocorpusculum sp.]|nr:S28 family serine protease [Methanocorpusculum sp.]
MKKVLFTGILAILLFAAVVSGACVSDNSRTFEEKLAGLDHVTSVEKLSGESADKYIAVFSLPLDWENLDIGSFPLRVEIIPRDGDSKYTVVETEGYIIQDASLKSDDPNEIASLLSANFVHIEHRFFGESAPAGFSNDGTQYWEYLTAENYAKDRHLILTELKTILPGKYVMTGSSKGGLDAVLFSRYYPEDVDLTVAYSAPCCTDFNDRRMMAYVYEHAGDEEFGEDVAAKYRSLLTDFQVFCLEHRDVLAQKYYEKALSEGCTFRPFCTADTLFDVIVLDVAMETWQYQYSFADIASCLAMPQNTNEELDDKLSAAFSLLCSLESPAQWSTSSQYYPYFYQTAHELGLYYYDFSYLRDAIAAKNADAVISIDREDEENLIARVMFTDAQNALISFNPETIASLREWIWNTDADIMLIYGASDPWYATKIPKNPANTHVKEYVSSTMAHQVSIADGFDAKTKERIIADIYAALA